MRSNTQMFRYANVCVEWPLDRTFASVWSVHFVSLTRGRAKLLVKYAKFRAKIPGKLGFSRFFNRIKKSVYRVFEIFRPQGFNSHTMCFYWLIRWLIVLGLNSGLKAQKFVWKWITTVSSAHCPFHPKNWVGNFQILYQKSDAEMSKMVNVVWMFWNGSRTKILVETGITFKLAKNRWTNCTGIIN